MQLVIDRTSKAMIAKQTKSKSEKGPRRMPSASLPLSMREKNAIRYMAGYVILKLKNKLSKKMKSGTEKRKWFVKVLTSMRMSGVDNDHVTSAEDYTKAWVEQVDRGGLYISCQ